MPYRLASIPAWSRALLLLSPVLLVAACSESHGTRDGSVPTDSSRIDTGPLDTGGGCPPEPAAEECRSLCQMACGAVGACGVDRDGCLDACYETFRCPGETVGMDRAICTALLEELPTDCTGLCSWVQTFGGYGTGRACPLGEWTTFRIREGFGPCPPGVICMFTFTVHPDGAVDVSDQGVDRMAIMSDTDFAAVDGHLQSESFQRAMIDGFTCDPPPTDVGVSFELMTGSASYAQGVTGCIYSGPPGNVPAEIHSIVTAY